VDVEKLLKLALVIDNLSSLAVYVTVRFGKIILAGKSLITPPVVFVVFNVTVKIGEIGTSLRNTCIYSEIHHNPIRRNLNTITFLGV
jgi:hypothetical protein